MKDYIHRVGRTARAGEKGRSISFAGEKDRPLLKQIIKRAKSKVKQRMLPSEPINEWREKIQKMEDDIEEIIQEEREERQVRKIFIYLIAMLTYIYQKKVKNC